MYPGDLQPGFKVNNKKNRRLEISPVFFIAELHTAQHKKIEINRRNGQPELINKPLKLKNEISNHYRNK